MKNKYENTYNRLLELGLSEDTANRVVKLSQQIYGRPRPHEAMANLAESLKKDMEAALILCKLMNSTFEEKGLFVDCGKDKPTKKRFE